jgi:hypothetical protein
VWTDALYNRVVFSAIFHPYRYTNTASGALSDVNNQAIKTPVLSCRSHNRQLVLRPAGAFPQQRGAGVQLPVYRLLS